MSKDFTEVTGEQSQGPLSTLKNTVFKKNNHACTTPTTHSGTQIKHKIYVE